MSHHDEDTQGPAYQLGKARIETQEKYFPNCGADLKKAVEEKRYVGGIDSQVACDSLPSQNPRDLIDRRIDNLRREADRLSALRRALPSEMTGQAERALLSIVRAAELSGW